MAIEMNILPFLLIYKIKATNKVCLTLEKLYQKIELIEPNPEIPHINITGVLLSGGFRGGGAEGAASIKGIHLLNR